VRKVKVKIDPWVPKIMDKIKKCHELSLVHLAADVWCSLHMAEFAKGKTRCIIFVRPHIIVPIDLQI